MRFPLNLDRILFSTVQRSTRASLLVIFLGSCYFLFRTNNADTVIRCASVFDLKLCIGRLLTEKSDVYFFYTPLIHIRTILIGKDHSIANL